MKLQSKSEPAVWDYKVSQRVTSLGEASDEGDKVQYK